MVKRWKLKSGWQKISCSVFDVIGLTNRVDYFLDTRIQGNQSLTMSEFIRKASVIFRQGAFFRCDEGEWVRCEPGLFYVDAYNQWGDEFPLEPVMWEVPE